MGYETVNDTMGGVLAGFHGHFAQLESSRFHRDITTLLTRLKVKGDRLVSYGRESDGRDDLV